MRLGYEVFRSLLNLETGLIREHGDLLGSVVSIRAWLMIYEALEKCSSM